MSGAVGAGAAVVARAARALIDVNFAQRAGVPGDAHALILANGDQVARLRLGAFSLGHVRAQASGTIRAAGHARSRALVDVGRAVLALPALHTRARVGIVRHRGYAPR